MSEEHAHPSYFKTYVILLILMSISLIGPEFGIQAVTLVTAFGIAGVKAYLVASRFMHLNIEKRFVVYMLTTCLAFMALLYSAIAPDIQRHTGTNWTKPAWIEREAAWEADKAAGKTGQDHHGEEAEAAHH
jgi:caa(3)-type oxidase subunit IV